MSRCAPRPPRPPMLLPRDRRPGTSRAQAPEPGYPRWVVVELHPDGTVGRPQVVTAAAAGQAAQTAGALGAREVQQLREWASVLQAGIGTRYVHEGRLHLAATAFLRGALPGAASPGREECLARLAHVLAVQGEMRRVEALLPGALLPGALRPGAVLSGERGAPVEPTHLHAAQAWCALQRGELADAGRMLALLSPGEASPCTTGTDAWLTTSLLVLQSQLMVASGAPESAVRLLAAAAEGNRDADPPEGLVDQLTLARAEALLEVGEPRRTLSSLTPVPPHARAAATVLTAAARHRVGDARGARSVLAQAEEQLDGEPLALQLSAWLLESRLSREAGDRVRSRELLDRTLRTASTEHLHLPLLRKWRWLRHELDAAPTLAHEHRELVAQCERNLPQAAQQRCSPETRSPAGPGSSTDAPTAALTTREREVLGLLAQMYCTEEIAEALFISTNTVKTHLKGIFGKLCVSRRVDAVRRGRQLDLC